MLVMPFLVPLPPGRGVSLDSLTGSYTPEEVSLGKVL